MEDDVTIHTLAVGEMKWRLKRCPHWRL